LNPNKKWLDLGLGVVAVATGFILYQILNSAWDYFRLPLDASWPVSIPQIAAFILALAIFVGLKRHKKVNEFGQEVILELSKVVWPTRQETVVSTGVIIIMVGIASGILFLFDTAWGTLTRTFLEF